MIYPTTKVLLEGLVDYAGLFPPAALEMEPAMLHYAERRAGASAWMLGRFVVPVSRLEEFERTAIALPPNRPKGPWRLSAIGGASPADDAGHITAFNRRNGNGRALIDTVEIRAADPAAVAAIAAARTPALQTYVEIPVAEDPAELLGAIGGAGLRAKLRIGGLTADAFPAPALVARFLRRAAGIRVPFKATAGLHHPLRGSYRLTYQPDAPTGMMYGFLNLFLAAAYAAHGMDDADLEAILQETDVAALGFDQAGVMWRGHRLSLGDLRALRASGAIAFGSCSFDEPVADLRALHLL